MTRYENSTGFRRLWHLFDVETATEFFLTLGTCLMLIVIVSLIISIFTGFKIVAEIVGLISNLTDSLTTLPPFITIVIHGDISCTTLILILQYISGTCFKAVLFLCRPVPWPFRVGLAIQAFLNLCIVVQFVRIRIRDDLSDSLDQTEEEDFENDEVSF